jgi:hypothetical protein
MPKVSKGQIAKVYLDSQLGQKLFPVPRFHCFTFELWEGLSVDFSVLLELGFVLIVDIVGTEPVRESPHSLKHAI